MICYLCWKLAVVRISWFCDVTTLISPIDKVTGQLNTRFWSWSLFYHFLTFWQNWGLTLLPKRPVAVFWYPENGHPSLFPVGQKGGGRFFRRKCCDTKYRIILVEFQPQRKDWILSSSIFSVLCLHPYNHTRVLFSEYPIRGNNVPISTVNKATTFQPYNMPIICDIFHLLINPLIRNFFGK